MDYVELIISIIASVLTSITLIPQAYKIIRSRDTSSISLLMFLTFGFAGIFWIILGFLIGNTALIITNVIVAIFAFSIFIFKLINVIKKGEKW